MKYFYYRVKRWFLKLVFRLKKLWSEEQTETAPEEKANNIKMVLRKMPQSSINPFRKKIGIICIDDVKALVADILAGSPDFSMDFNANGSVDISDVVKMVNMVLEVERERKLSLSLLGYDFTNQPSNKILYRTYNGKKCDVFDKEGFGAELVSNTYDQKKGYGVIEFAGNITAIPNYAFYCGVELISLSIPDKVINIGAHAFANCIRLESVVLQDSVERINIAVNTSEGGSFAFDDCISLKNIISLSPKAAAIDWSTFRDMGNIGSRKLYVERDAVNYESWLKVGQGSAVYLGNYDFKLNIL